MQKMHILLVEDDINMGYLLAEYLEDNNFKVILCKDGEAGLKSWRSSMFDFCIIDIMLPRMDGYTLVKKIREQNKEIPVILLTAKAMKEDKLRGFELGIDDYITKPFDEEELLCRIRAILTRSSKKGRDLEPVFFEVGKYKFDYTNQLLTIGENEKRLTKKENETLKILCLSKNKIARRDEILLSVWGKNDYFTGRSLDVFITKLRKYLKEDILIKIEGVPTVGYILSDS